ncbi:MAG: hypothetical protein ACNS62_22450 [Candidatus Cyclobacteriaceae bacterium M3_2C_046]
MSDILDEFKNTWDAAKKDVTVNTDQSSKLISLSRQRMRKIRLIFVANISILVFTLIIISAYFYYVAHFREILSLTGMVLMTGGLSVRILIEFYSMYMAGKIDISGPTARVNSEYLNFYHYRKTIHGPVTIAILIGYSVGFYFLIPEFGNYFNQSELMLLAFSYLVAAAIFGFFIRQGIRDEMKHLKSLLQLDKQLYLTED